LSTETIATVSLDIARGNDDGNVIQTAKARKPLTHKAYLNGFSSLLDTAVKGGVMAVVTPMIVAGLGSSLFGVWQILGRLITYMHAADGRPTQALKWVIANRQEIDDDETKRRHVGSAMGVWVLFLPVLALMSAGLVYISPYITKVPAEQFTSIRITCALLVVSFLLIQLISLPEAVLRGMNLGYKRLGLQASLNIVGGALTIGALYIGSGMIGLAAAQTILTAITGIFFLFVVKKYVSWYGVARPTFVEVRSFLKLSFWWFLWTMVQKFLIGSDILVLGLVASTSLVASYTLTGFASMTLLSLVTIVLGAVAPGLGGVIGRKEFDRITALRLEMISSSWLLLCALGSTILLWNRSFINLWVGETHYAGLWTNLLIVLMIVQLIFIRNDAYVIDLLLQMREKVLMGIVAAVVSIGLSAFLIPRFGIAGLCAGMIVGRLALTISYPFVIHKHLGRSWQPGIGHAVRPAAAMLIMFTASAYLGEFLLVENWLVWFLCAAVSFSLALGLAVVAGLNAEVRGLLKVRVRLLRTLFASR
jgi:O-antigen/teichoic acid export membrane protein